MKRAATLLHRIAAPVLCAAVLAASAPQSRATGLPVFDAVSNTLHLKDLASEIETLKTDIQGLAVVKQILEINYELTSAQKTVTDSIGTVRSLMSTVQNYASEALGTINYWKNFQVKNLIPFFDPKVFTAYQQYLDMKQQFQGMTQDASKFTQIQPGQPFQYATLDAYYNREMFMDSLDQAQRNYARGVELGQEKDRIGGLKTANEFLQSAAKDLNTHALIGTEILDQTIGQNRNMSLIDEAKREAHSNALRAAYGDQLSGFMQ